MNSILYHDENISADQTFCNDLCEIVTVFPADFKVGGRIKIKRSLA